MIRRTKTVPYKIVKIPQVILDLQEEQSRIMVKLGEKKREIQNLEKYLEEVLAKISKEINKL